MRKQGARDRHFTHVYLGLGLIAARLDLIDLLEAPFSLEQIPRGSFGRIVNLSTALGSLATNGDPASPFYSARLIGYNASKVAVNMLTVQLAHELKGSSIIVNAVSPGFVKTDLTRGQGFLTPQDGAKTPVHYALLEEDTVTGRFVSAYGEIPW